MSKSRNVRASARDAKAKGGASDYAGAARALPVMALVWTGLLPITALASLCPRFTAYYAVYLFVTIGLAAGSLAFLDAIYRGKKAALHPAFKKFLGYGLVLHYAAAAMPRVDWAGDGLIGPGRVAYLFALASLCLAAGVVLFVASGRPAAYAALGLIADEEVRDKALRKKRFSEHRKKGLLYGVLEWADALGFAAILVILINTFVFQLYEIPSESMVPAFLMKDRPFTGKFEAGPRVPLTDWRLPFLRLPRRGDIITLANPRYPENRTVNLKKYLAQLVSMVTFTAVNIDKYLPDGSQKADPLVKRIVGVPGEKLMMIDDVLYSRRKGDAAFAPVEADKAWANVDLWKLDDQKRMNIRDVPIRASQRAILDKWDARRLASDPAAVAASIGVSARAIESEYSAARAMEFLRNLGRARPDTYRLVANDIDDLGKASPDSPNPISARCSPTVSSRQHLYDLALALSLSASPPLRSALIDYAAAAGSSVHAADPYDRSRRMLNLLIKDNLLRRVRRVAELVSAGAGFDELSRDEAFSTLYREGDELGIYAGLYDMRNIPVFPSGDSYLGPEQYFAMGDNRYNSLDFRYKTGLYTVKAIDPADPSSAVYDSDIDPFPLDRRFIEGYALFRIWPPSRIGAIR